MEENLQTEEGISLLDIVKLLLSKIKWLILVGIVGGLLGGCFAIWRTIDVNYYGTTVEFYVNPENPTNSNNSESQYGVYGAYGRHVMDNMIKLLESESFTEKLILDGEILPEPDEWTSSEEENKLQLNSLIASAKNSVAIYEEAVKTKVVPAETAAKEGLLTLQKEWNLAIASVSGHIYEGVSYSKTNYEMVSSRTEFMQNIDGRYTNLKNAYNDYEGENGLKAQYENAVAEVSEKKETADENVETALEAWRQTEKYISSLSKFGDAVSYSYLQADDDIDDANNLARSFIYVEISVLGDSNKDFANDLLKRVKTVVPAYVEENMTVPTGYQGTNCQRITRTDGIHLTNVGYTTNEAIKYALLLAVAAVAVACVIIIIIDRSDKRLRDYDILTKKFNVPVLGVVPTIEALKEENEKKEAKK